MSVDIVKNGTISPYTIGIPATIVLSTIAYKYWQRRKFLQEQEVRLDRLNSYQEKEYGEDTKKKKSAGDPPTAAGDTPTAAENLILGTLGYLNKNWAHFPVALLATIVGLEASSAVSKAMLKKRYKRLSERVDRLTNTTGKGLLSKKKPAIKDEKREEYKEVTAVPVYPEEYPVSMYKEASSLFETAISALMTAPGVTMAGISSIPIIMGYALYKKSKKEAKKEEEEAKILARGHGRSMLAYS